MKNKFLSLVSIAVIYIAVLGLTVTVFSQEAKQKTKTKIETKELQGEITWMGRGQIAIVFARNEEKGTEEEILLPIDTGIKVEHKRRLEEIGIGDTVAIQFQEITEEGPAGTNVTRKAKVISFIRKGTPKPISAVVVPANESAVLGTE